MAFISSISVNCKQNGVNLELQYPNAPECSTPWADLGAGGFLTLRPTHLYKKARFFIKRELLCNTLATLPMSLLKIPSAQISEVIDDHSAEQMVSSNLKEHWLLAIKHIRSLEDEGAVRGEDFLATVQGDYITKAMRVEVVAFMVDIAAYDGLAPAIAERAVRLFDQCLRTERLRRSSLQLVALASILVAAKMDDVTPPSLSALAYYADGQYSTRDIAEAERRVLEMVGWHANIPTAHSVAGSLVARVGPTPLDAASIFSQASQIITGAVSDYSLGRRSAVTLAIAAVHVALFRLGLDGGPLTELQGLTDMTAADEVVEEIMTRLNAGKARSLPYTPVDIKRSL